MDTAAMGQDAVSEVIRPAAIVPEDAARRVLVALARRDVGNGGLWQCEPTVWNRYDTPWAGADAPGGAALVGSLLVAYGTPTKYEITVYRVTVTRAGLGLGWDVEALTDDALRHGGLTLASCPRATLAPPPEPFRG